MKEESINSSFKLTQREIYFWGEKLSTAANTYHLHPCSIHLPCCVMLPFGIACNWARVLLNCLGWQCLSLSSHWFCRQRREVCHQYLLRKIITITCNISGTAFQKKKWARHKLTHQVIDNKCVKSMECYFWEMKLTGMCIY